MKIFEEKLPEYNVIGTQEIDQALKVLKQGQLSGFIATAGNSHLGGKHVRKLEELFCNKFNSEFSASFNSATSALHAALVSCGLNKNDEVLVPTMSMSASATSVLMAGGKPVFVDIESDYFCIDTNKIYQSITKKTKGIITVNLFGMPSDLKKIRKICDDFNLFMIEDNAQAPAAKYENRYTGTFGDISVYSLNRHKTIQCGEGGIATTNEKELIHKLRLVRNHSEAVYDGLTNEEKSLGGENIIGYNYRLTCLQAAVAIPQIKKLDRLNLKRVALANELNKKLLSIDFLEAPKLRKNTSHVYYLYPMIFNPTKAKISKEKFLKNMLNEGAPISEYAPPIYTMSLFKNCIKGLNIEKKFPVTEFLSKHLLVTSICRPPLTKKHIYKFYKAILKSSKE